MKNRQYHPQSPRSPGDYQKRLILLACLILSSVVAGQTEPHGSFLVSFEGFDAECCVEGDCCISGTHAPGSFTLAVSLDGSGRILDDVVMIESTDPEFEPGEPSNVHGNAVKRGQPVDFTLSGPVGVATPKASLRFTGTWETTLQRASGTVLWTDTEYDPFVCSGTGTWTGSFPEACCIGANRWPPDPKWEPPLRVEAESGDVLECEPPSNDVSLWYYREGWEGRRRIARCCWPEGAYNQRMFAAYDDNGPDGEPDNKPDCFVRVIWKSWDLGYDDCPPEKKKKPAYLDCIMFSYDTCSDWLRITHLYYDYDGLTLPVTGSELESEFKEGGPHFRSQVTLWEGRSKDAEAGFFQAPPSICSPPPSSDGSTGTVSFHSISDLDWDGDCDDADLRIARNALGRSSGEPSYDCRADIDLDGFVSDADLQLIFGSDWLGLAHWKLDETGGMIAYDSAGENDGIVCGASAGSAPSWLPSGGQDGGALHFDGIDDYVDCGSSSALAAERMTIAFWMLMEGSTSYQYILGKATGMGSERDYTFSTGSDGKLEFAFGESAFKQIAVRSKESMLLGQWVHVAATRNGTTASLFLNGQLESSAAYSFAVTDKGQSLRIGSIGLPEPDWAGFFRGKIDDVRIYNKALTADEIQELYKDPLAVQRDGGIPVDSSSWARRVASNVGTEENMGVGMDIDSQSNVYATGWFNGTNDFGGVTLASRGGGQDIFVVKYSTAGNLQWVQRAGGSSSSEDDAGRGVGVDAAGNVYVTGEFSSTADFGGINVTAGSSNDCFFLAKYDANGVAQWVRQNACAPDRHCAGDNLAVDASGNSYVLGSFDGATITFGATTITNASSASVNRYLVKYDAAGVVHWAIGITSTVHSMGSGVSLDRDGNIYVAGVFRSDVRIGNIDLNGSSVWNSFVAKLNSSGVPLWAQVITSASGARAFGVRADNQGSVYVSGSFGPSVGTTASFGPSVILTSLGGGSPGTSEGDGLGDAFLAKYNGATGALQWARRAGGAGMDVFVGVTTDAQGNVYAAGGFMSGGDAGGLTVPTNANWHVVVAKYDPNGTVQELDYAETTEMGFAMAVDVDGGGNRYLAGWYQGLAAFGTNVLESAGTWNYFLAKLAGPGFHGNSRERQ